MPRIFQHIDKSSEETLGKVTRLKYIDDITEEDVFYYFEDGSCCNVEFIAPYDTQDPLNSHKAMIEVPSPNSLWQFKKREKIELDTDKKVARADDGNVYEAPPMLTKDGMEIDPNAATKDEYDVVRAPRIPTNFKRESDDDYLLSVHPELEAPVATTSSSTSSFIKKKVKTAETSAQSVTPSIAVQKKAKKVEPVQDFDFDAEAGTVATPRQEESLQDVNMRQQAIILNYEDEIRRLKEENIQLKNAFDVRSDNNAIYTIPDEDPFIKSMVTKSKKKTCKITMSIQFDLPPKEVYDTIKTAYEDGMADKFVSSLTARIPRESLLESLNGGLKRFYEGKPVSSAAEKPAAAPKKS